MGAIFARIFKNVAQIFRDFARIFNKSKLFGVSFHPLHPAFYHFT